MLQQSLFFKSTPYVLPQERKLLTHQMQQILMFLHYLDQAKTQHNTNYSILT